MSAERKRRFPLKLLGGCSLEAPDGTPLTGRVAQRRPIACLAVVAASGRGGVSRDRLVALLWPESATEPARHRLADTLHVLRAALGDDALPGVGERVTLNPDVVACDVLTFDDAVRRGDAAAAVAAYGGLFLDGLHVPGAPEFDRWADAERERRARDAARALESLAEQRAAAGDHVGAVAWWRRLAAHAPYDSRVALRLMDALDAAGDPAGAVRHAEAHGTLLRGEIGVEPAPEVVALAERLRRPATAATGAAVDRRPSAAGSEVGRARAVASDGAGGTIAPPSGPLVPPTALAPTVPVPAVPTPVAALRGSGGRAAGPRRALAVAGTAAVALALAVALAVTALRIRATSATAAPGLDATVVAVAPFRTGGADPSLAYLHEGMLDLLAAILTGDGGPRATEPRTLLNAWRRAAPAASVDLPERAALRVAHELGAGRLLLGSVVGTPDRLVLTASLLAVPTGATQATSRVEGPQDSLSALVERLATRLVARESGDPERVTALSRTSLPALQAYLAAQEAYRHGRYPAAVAHLDRAVEFDSTFALAALGRVAAAWWPTLVPVSPRAAALARAHRDRLGMRDRTLLAAYVGRRGPSCRCPSTSTGEQLAAWRRAVTLMPDRPEAWLRMADPLFHFGALLGVPQARDSAATAFRRVLELDSSSTMALDHLLQIAILADDTVGVQRYARLYHARDSTSEQAGYLRWRVAHALGDTLSLRAARGRFDQDSAETLRTIVGTGSQLGGAMLADAERAAAVLRRRAQGNALTRHFALNRGAPRAALQWADRLGPRDEQQQRVAEALYWDGDTTAAAAAVRAWWAAGAAPLPRDAAERDHRIREQCLTEQWRLWRGETRTARRVIATLRGLAAGPDSAALDPAAPVCAALLEALLATTERRPDAAAAVDRLEALSVRHGMFSGDPPHEAHATNLVIARLRAATGDSTKALAAIRRRPDQFLWGSLFLSSYLREEGRIAAATGDTAGAIRALRHYVALRSTPEAPLRVEVARARAELAWLERVSAVRPLSAGRGSTAPAGQWRLRPSAMRRARGGSGAPPAEGPTSAAQ